MKFRGFNLTINPNNEKIYLDSKDKLLSYDEAVDTLQKNHSQLRWIVPKNYVVYKFSNQAMADKLVKENAPIYLWITGQDFFCVSYGRDTQTRHARCGVEIEQYGEGETIPLPFYVKSNASLWAQNTALLIENYPILDMPIYMQAIRRKESSIFAIPSTTFQEPTMRLYIEERLGDLEPSIISNIISIIDDYLIDVPITRDEELGVVRSYLSDISATWFDKGRFFHNLAGDYVARICHIHRDSSKRLYYYDHKHNIYKQDDDILRSKITQICPVLKEAQKTEVIEYIRQSLYEDDSKFNSNPYSVVFRNGILNVVTMEFKPMSPAELESIQIAIDYTPDISKLKHDTADSFFATATCGNKVNEQLLYEAMGYSLVKTSELAKSFILLGSGRNGKSTYLDIMKAIMGNSNYTAISLKDLNTTFRTSALCDKLASFAGDISSKPIEDTDVFKSIVAAEEVQVEKKHENSFTTKLFATMFFSCNKLPQSTDTSNGFFRRVVIVPFRANLSAVSTVDGAKFHEALLEEQSLQYMTYKAIIAINRVLTTTKEFTTSDDLQGQIMTYRRQSSNTLCWINDTRTSKEEIKKYLENGYTGQWAGYQRFVEYCNNTGRRAANMQNWTETLTIALENFDKLIENKAKPTPKPVEDEDDLPM